MFKICLKNHICKLNKAYTCFICNSGFNANDITEHVNSLQHGINYLKIDQSDRDKYLAHIEQLSDIKAALIVRNQVTLYNKCPELFCHACDCRISGFRNIFEHIKGTPHFNHLQLNNLNNKKTESKKNKNLTNGILSSKENSSNSCCDSKKNSTNVNCLEVVKSVKKGKSKSVNKGDAMFLEANHVKKLNKKFYCVICNTYYSVFNTVVNHIRSKAHQNKMFSNVMKDASKNEVNIEQLPCSQQKKNTEKISNGFYCDICNISLYDAMEVIIHNMLHLHEKHNFHSIDIMQFCKAGNKNIIDRKCLLCEENFKDDKSLFHHLKTLKHVQRLRLFKDYKNEIYENNFIEKLIDSCHVEKVAACQSDLVVMYFCNICSQSIKETDLQVHCSNRRHLKIFKEDIILPPKFNKFFNYLYMCFMCNKYFKSMDELFLHLNKDEKHKTAMECFNSSYFHLATSCGGKSDYIGCTICNSKMYNIESLINHSNSAKHLINKELICNNEVAVKNIEKSDVRFEKIKIIDKESSKQENNVSILNENTNRFKPRNLLDFTEGLSKISSKSAVPMPEYFSNVIYAPIADENLTDKSNKISTANCFKNLPKPRNLLEPSTNQGNTIGHNISELKNPFSSPNIMFKPVEKYASDTKTKNEPKKATKKRGNLDMKESFDDIITDLMGLELSRKVIKSISRQTKQKENRRRPTKKQKSCKNIQHSKDLMHYAKKYISFCIELGQENIYIASSRDISTFIFGLKHVCKQDKKRICIICDEKFTNCYDLIYEHLLSEKHKTNLKNFQDEDKKYKNEIDFTTSLQLAQSFMIDRSYTDSKVPIKCFACKGNNVPNEEIAIKTHIKSQKHVNMLKKFEEESQKDIDYYNEIYQDIWYYSQYFFCEFCNFKTDFEIDYVKHLVSSKHFKKIRPLANKTIKFNLCPVCMFFWCGRNESFDNHCQNGFHKQCLQQDHYKIPALSKFVLNFLKQTANNIKKLVNESDKATADKTQIVLMNSIENTLKTRFPKAKAYIFGSRSSYLGFPDSDVDVFVDCDGFYSGLENHEKSEKNLLIAENYFANDKYNWTIEETILSTRVPIIKLRHLGTGLKSDVSFSNGLGVEKSSLIRKFNEAYPKCREAMLYLKKWFSLCRLSGTSSVTTYTISWLVIFYLQSLNIFPSVHRLLELGSGERIVAGWDCGFADKVPCDPKKMSIIELIKGFFTYYEKFNYKSEIMCPFLGKTIKKSNFATLNIIPDEMSIYKDRLAKEDLEFLRIDSPMCLQDPVDLSQNVSKALKKLDLRKFKQFCCESAKNIK